MLIRHKLVSNRELESSDEHNQVRLSSLVQYVNVIITSLQNIN